MDGRTDEDYVKYQSANLRMYELLQVERGKSGCIVDSLTELRKLNA